MPHSTVATRATMVMEKIETLDAIVGGNEELTRHNY